MAVKKILSLVLAVSIAVSMLSGFASAALPEMEDVWANAEHEVLIDDEVKTYSKATLEDDFDDDVVIVTLN